MGKDVWGCNPSFKSRVNSICSDTGTLDDLQRVNVGTKDHEVDRTISSNGAGILTGDNTDFDGTVAWNDAGQPANSPPVPNVRAGDYVIVPTNFAGFTKHLVTAVTSATKLEVLPTVEEIKVEDAITGIQFARDLIEQSHKNQVSTLWVPPLGIFENVEKLGAGDFRISMNPNSNYKTSAVESNRNVSVYNPNNKVADTFDLEIVDVKLYIALCKDTVSLSGTEQLFLEEQQIQTKLLTGKSSSLQFSVPSSTTMIAFCLQSTQAGSDTRFPSTKFKTVGDYDMSLENFQLTYANRSRPSTKWSSEYSNATNTIQQRYHDTYSEVQMSTIQGGVQTLSEFIQAGPIYCYRFDRDSSDRSTEVNLQINMKYDAPQTNVVLCSFYNRTVEMSYNNGQIVDVRSLSV